ncbi:carbohydrate ABC transporter permease [Terrabacter sp. MAHUQ-38]|uniref:carbohydrate ABC transporter permease n=1 Tax=unclassified Terrabacter TaxID=2630222 RepID=UPI00165E3637|nr:sugar ABC transporter permease [Terrabacter sp. MAHUQ-38]MBC9822636.1 sugar ABC transporter permease [Terrabacter sp. MAHUQ-38]
MTAASAPVRERPPRGRVHRGRVNTRRLAPYLFLLPNMLIFAVFTIWPALNGFNLSFYDSSNGRTFKPVGTGNYSAILSDEEFWAVVRHTLVYTVGFVLISTVLAMALALMINAQRRGRGAISAAYFLPIVISPVVVGIVWRAAFDRERGMVNQGLSAVGLGEPGWLVEPSLAMVAIIVVGTWIHLGFYAMILMSGLQSIDGSLYEAARIDGTTTWQAIRLITMPLLRPTLMVVVILATIAGFQSFDFIFTLTGGGPVSATTLMVQYIYENGFSYPIEYGLASAAAVILFVVVFMVTFANYVLGRRSDSI